MSHRPEALRWAEALPSLPATEPQRRFILPAPAPSLPSCAEIAEALARAPEAVEPARAEAAGLADSSTRATRPCAGSLRPHHPAAWPSPSSPHARSNRSFPSARRLGSRPISRGAPCGGGPATATTPRPAAPSGPLHTTSSAPCCSPRSSPPSTKAASRAPSRRPSVSSPSTTPWAAGSAWCATLTTLTPRKTSCLPWSQRSTLCASRPRPGLRLPSPARAPRARSPSPSSPRTPVPVASRPSIAPSPSPLLPRASAPRSPSPPRPSAIQLRPRGLRDGRRAPSEEQARPRPRPRAAPRRPLPPRRPDSTPSARPARSSRRARPRRPPALRALGRASPRRPLRPRARPHPRRPPPAPLGRRQRYRRPRHHLRCHVLRAPEGPPPRQRPLPGYSAPGRPRLRGLLRARLHAAHLVVSRKWQRGGAPDLHLRPRSRADRRRPLRAAHRRWCADPPRRRRRRGPHQAPPGTRQGGGGHLLARARARGRALALRARLFHTAPCVPGSRGGEAAARQAPSRRSPRAASSPIPRATGPRCSPTRCASSAKASPCAACPPPGPYQSHTSAPEVRVLPRPGPARPRRRAEGLEAWDSAAGEHLGRAARPVPRADEGGRSLRLVRRRQARPLGALPPLFC